ncbi:Hsp20/alpha crystallin family protein [Chelatococcus daeguensis]|uniref:Molecular chaperone Hsp20 n=1 Tax=Chelatococcus daeguensis TaxID=444444 RepID=A0AAC9JQW0_9HYPH|nr:Hsp20/alpha crystallin family protein [Chelatococcus daeguensis]APF36761.1 molecular chaperone Hsp20 [Chelatococcus daeguensis]KZE27947.1 molecular chaperone Hsp20 [Chelatococcus daeguensis]MBM3084511.1 Hsp20/alpha crystallin family protein [Chelatococcus daeguensis]
MPEATKLPIETEKQTAPAPAARWTPFDSLRREIDRLFDDLHVGSWRMPFARAEFQSERPWLRESAFALTPAVDVVEREKEYEISAELPGLEQKDVEVRLANGTLIVRGEKRETKEEHDKDYYVSERRYGTFMRSFRVPDTVDTAGIEARFANGVLTVKLPKSAEARKNEKKIDVKTG